MGRLKWVAFCLGVGNTEVKHISRNSFVGHTDLEITMMRRSQGDFFFFLDEVLTGKKSLSYNSEEKYYEITSAIKQKLLFYHSLLIKGLKRFALIYTFLCSSSKFL